VCPNSNYVNKPYAMVNLTLHLKVHVDQEEPLEQ